MECSDLSPLFGEGLSLQHLGGVWCFAAITKAAPWQGAIHELPLPTLTVSLSPGSEPFREKRSRKVTR
jgi:hypothetical protein